MTSLGFLLRKIVSAQFVTLNESVPQVLILVIGDLEIPTD
jgi:hypothetical protein